MVEVQKKEESRAVLCDFSRFIFGKDIYTTKWYQYPSTLIWKIIRIYYNYMINTDEVHHMTEVQPTFETVVSLDFILFLYITVKKCNICRVWKRRRFSSLVYLEPCWVKIVYMPSRSLSLCLGPSSCQLQPGGSAGRRVAVQSEQIAA